MTDEELKAEFLRIADELYERGYRPPTILFDHINKVLVRDPETGRMAPRRKSK